jgi:hypothetical protein
MSLYETMATPCPFEKIKHWKTGVSVKCPRMTTVAWTSIDKDKAIYDIQCRNRRLTCVTCKEEFKKLFLEIK